MRGLTLLSSNSAGEFRLARKDRGYASSDTLLMNVASLLNTEELRGSLSPRQRRRRVLKFASSLSTGSRAATGTTSSARSRASAIILPSLSLCQSQVRRISLHRFSPLKLIDACPLVVLPSQELGRSSSQRPSSPSGCRSASPTSSTAWVSSLLSSHRGSKVRR